MNIQIGYEKFGRVRDEFLALGHNVWSCDLEPDQSGTAGASRHIVRDVWEVIAAGAPDNSGAWDMGIFFPVCTYVCGSGLHHCKTDAARGAKRDWWIENFRRLDQLPDSYRIRRVAIENPIGALSRVRKPDQIVHPWMFGDDASKATCLWLRGLKKLEREPQLEIAPRLVVRNGNMYKRWSNQTDSGQNRLGPSPDRAALRGKTYNGIAQAMGRNWG